MKVYRGLTSATRAIAARTLPEGGMLIHGALAERDGYGVILAAPGGTGKTTASNRLPPPWHSLSDDATLVVRDRAGMCRAHPRPTWSRFADNGPGGSWDVQQSVPLAALFFLSRSDDDLAEPLDAGEAAAFVIESVHQIMGTAGRTGCTLEESASLCGLELAAVTALADRIPAWQLKISRTGAFWEVIASVLGERNEPARTGMAKDASGMLQWREGNGVSAPQPALFGAGHIPIVYTGPSMNPTLQAPDLLDVVPYGERTPAVGDVICFPRPGDDQIIVHRVTGISASGIRTRGDNTNRADPWLVEQDRVIGMVTGATRGTRVRKIAGGTSGRIIHRWMRTRSFVLQATGKILHLAKPALVITRASSRLLFGSWKPRIVIFSSRHTRIPKFFFGTSIAGEFSTIRRVWTIRFPFGLLVDETALPVVERPEPVNPQDIASQPINPLP
ncbi:MAG: hypothetical protein STSR0009_27230 [Methanoregula sp.]